MYLLTINPVNFIKNHQAGNITQIKLMQQCLNHFYLLLPLRVRNINYMQEKICLKQFFQGGLKRFEQVRRKVTNEADSIGDDHLQILRKTKSPAGRIQGCKQQILSLYLTFGEGIEQG